MQPARAWIIFAAVALPLIAADLAYLKWREQSLEPLSAPVDLTRPGTYTFLPRGFHASEYHPAFNLQLPFTTDVHNWFDDDGYRQLWGDSPPLIEIVVHDSKGNLVLHDTSSLTRSDGWVVMGSPPAPWVEVYKFAEFKARMFGSYRVSLRILGGSPNALKYQSRFEIEAIKAHALLPASLGFGLLLVALTVAAAVLGVIQLVKFRRNKQVRDVGAV